MCFEKCEFVNFYNMFSVKRLFSTILILFPIIGVVFYYPALTISTEDEIQILYIENSKPPVFKTSLNFLSLALDDAVIAENFKDFDMRNETLIKMIRHLSPGYLRIGGNLADRLNFSVTNKKIVEYEYLPNITLTASDWLKLCEFSKQTYMDLFFGLNVLQRFQNGSWDYRNAERLIQFSNFSNLDVNWELGNEPNLYKNKFNREVNATQMAKDFHTLRNILNIYQYYEESLLIGPDVIISEDGRNESEIYLKDFIKNAKHTVDKITFHQYYMNGRTAQPKDFLDPKIYDLLKFQINKVKEIRNNSETPIWLGQTASTYAPGAPNLSDRFIGTFMWLDKLGLAAKMGVEVVIREALFYGNNSLLDKNYNPNPDWWVSLMYKSLVGSTVVPSRTVANDKIRLYVHCLQDGSLQSIVIFGVNLDKTPAKVRIEGLIPYNNVPLYIYALELQAADLFSKDVHLNGIPLKMLPGSKVPNILAMRKTVLPYVIMPPYSLVFWYTTKIHVKACPGWN